MLGDLIYQGKGKLTGHRILNVKGPKIETSFTAQSKFIDTEVIEMGTFWSVPRSGGAMYGEDKSVVMTRDGKELGTGTANGIGQFTGPGKISYRGSAIFSTASTGKLAVINNKVIVFEVEVDNEADSIVLKGWEWK